MVLLKFHYQAHFKDTLNGSNVVGTAVQIDNNDGPKWSSAEFCE
jgi:hypothetical protein